MSQATPIAPVSLWGRMQQAFVDFVAKPASPRPLAALRIGVSVVLLLQALFIASSVLELFGPRGVVQWHLSEVLTVGGIPKASWIVNLLAPLGVSEVVAIRGTFILYVAGLSMLMMGWHTRVAAVIAWLTHMTLMMSERSSLYGVDDFAHIVLFYFMWMPVGNYWSMDEQAGRVSRDPSFAARLGLRVIQIHLCIVYLSSGIEKALTPPYQWWDGEVIWRTATLPTFQQFPMEWLADYSWIAKLASWGALAIELGYAFLVWPKMTRKFMAINTVLLHLGIAILMGLWSFGAIMMVLSASVWLVDSEPRTES